MKFRVARHTADLSRMISFYRDILGLEVLGKFKDHQQYDGVFLGLKDADWHLEFTTSPEQPVHAPDEDDLLVFYADSATELEQFKDKFKASNIAETEPKNPYWKENGVTYTDPDGFRIVIALARNKA